MSSRYANTKVAARRTTHTHTMHAACKSTHSRRLIHPSKHIQLTLISHASCPNILLMTVHASALTRPPRPRRRAIPSAKQPRSLLAPSASIIRRGLRRAALCLAPPRRLPSTASLPILLLLPMLLTRHHKRRVLIILLLLTLHIAATTTASRRHQAPHMPIDHILVLLLVIRHRLERLRDKRRV